MKSSALSILIVCLLLSKSIAIGQTTKTKTTKTTTTTKKSSKPDVEINMEGKIEINVFGDGDEKTNTTTTTTNRTNNKPSKSTKQNTNQSNSYNENDEIQATETLSATSKYDFISGEKVILMEDFSNTGIGDFPLNWNTNSSAEVVSLSNQSGKWLQLNQKGAFLMEKINQFPENFTFEFDVVCTTPYGFNSSGLFLNIANLKNKVMDYTKWTDYAGKNEGIKIAVEPSAPDGKMAKMGKAAFYAYNTNQANVKSLIKTQEFNDEVNPKAHIAIWRQKERVRVYINQKKVFDIPKAMMASSYNALFFTTKNMVVPDNLYISNIKFAVGGADTRTKLIDEGKFSTSGILFDVNADVIKPESYGVLLTIANIMNENSNLRIKIVGHTDSDGDAAKNLDLSERRANAVKNYLIKNYGISGSRIETDGKGSSQPIDKATTKEAKANNRRVEFIKL